MLQHVQIRQDLFWVSHLSKDSLRAQGCELNALHV